MDSLQSLLPSVLRKRGLKDQADAALLIHRTQGWLTETLPHSHILAKSFSNGELCIECGDSVAAQECQGQLEQLKEYLATQGDIPQPANIRLLRS